MTREKPALKIAGISDAAVRKATGKSWAAWLRILDRKGARAMTHREIAGWLAADKKTGPWWSQMLTVGYEQARGLRAPHQRTHGFTVSVSRILATSLARVYAHWSEDDRRADWLAQAGAKVRSARRNKFLSIDWGDGKTLVEARFTAKDRARTQVTVEHSRLASSADVERKRALWKRALLRLAASLNGSPRKCASHPRAK